MSKNCTATAREPDGWRAAALAACEARLAASVAEAADARVRELARMTLTAGGKRLRPAFVIASAPAREPDPATEARLASGAAAVELLHMATLVHDDVIDRAPVRRGRRTVVAVAGAAAATQVGDVLMARAMVEAAGSGVPEAVAALADATRALTEGELMQQAAAGDLDLTEERYLARCRGKTGALFAVSCRLGALLGGAGPAAQRRLGRFGVRVGVAFQILDDVMDLVGDVASTGKRRGADLRDGTVTLPLILALDEEPGLRGPLRRAMRDESAVEPLCERLAGHPGIARAAGRAREMLDEAREALDGPLDGVDAGRVAALADRALGAGALAPAMAR
jgi:geranylgeranyl pyrophosphate synthase